MFTGLVEHMGTITKIEPLDESTSGGGGWSMTIGDSAPVLDDCHIGDSICTNGACLTVTEFDKDSFKVGIAPETLTKTNLGDLKVGEKVNLERAMAAHVRFGGHMVQGHVETTAELVSATPTGNAVTLGLRLQSRPGLPAPASLSPYLIPKGYITLDGASLTLIDVSPPVSSDNQAAQVEFTVMLIAHTQAHITLASKKPGDRVNVELDMVGKYAYRAIAGAAAGEGKGKEGVEDALERMVERVLERVLARRGLP